MRHYFLVLGPNRSAIQQVSFPHQHGFHSITLNILSSKRIDGLSGTGGGSGRNGTFEFRSGGTGGDGTSGRGVGLKLASQTFSGDPGGDTVTFEWQAVGGAGGSGGLGGSGANASATVTSSSSPGLSRTDAFYDGAGGGGGGGAAGLAGRANVTFENLAFDMAGGPTSQNAVRLLAIAWGGNGGGGGVGGNGGSSGATSTSSSSTSGPPSFTQIYNQQGTPGGQSGEGTPGADGGLTNSRQNGLMVTGENVLVTLLGTALGGSGGAGGAGARGSSGSTGAAGGSGGDGGDGARALAEVTNLDVRVTGGLNLSILLTARGGQGNQGGGGGDGEEGTISASTFTNGLGSSLTTTVYAPSGSGGNGGAGGGGLARVSQAVIVGSDAVDVVDFNLTAAGGLGGNGGFGGRGVESSTSSGENSVTTVSCIARGPQGADGGTGWARVEISGVSVDLGGGNDTLSFALLANGPGTNATVVARSGFAGGAGTDTLHLGNNTAGEARAVVDVHLGTLKLGSGSGNTISGFEVFRGGAGDDRFFDGTGDHTYSGGLGSDTFIFTAGRNGADRIEQFAVDDVIRLRGFGPTLDSYAEVIAVSTETGAGVLIQTGAASSILLAGLTLAELTAADLTF